MTRSEAARLLRVEPDADDAAVRAAFRAVARGAHPDASEGGNPQLLAAAKDARDVLLGVVEASPEPVPLAASPDGAGGQGPFDVPGSYAAPHPGYVGAVPRPGPAMQQPGHVVWETPGRERRSWLPILAFVGIFALLLVGAVLGALILVRDQAEDITSLIPTPEPAVEQTDEECVLVRLSPASVVPADCQAQDAQRIMGVFGGQLDCPFDLNELYVAGQTWCLQPADAPVDPTLNPAAQPTPPGG